MQLGRTRAIPVAAILVASLVAGLPSSASAQEIMKRGFRALDTSTLMEPRVPSNRFLPATSMTFKQPVGFRPPRRQRNSSAPLTARITLAALIGLAGATLGAELGMRLEGDCRCDDPGLRGALIGMPIGAAAGVALGIAVTR